MLWGVCVWLLAIAPLHAATQLTVLPFNAPSLSDNDRAVLDVLLVQAVAQHKEFDVVSLSDLNLMFGLQRLRDIVGCDRVSCYAELSRALGARYLVAGTIHELDSKLYYSLTMLDTAKNTVLSRAHITYSADAYFYPFAVNDAVQVLFAFEHKARPEAATPAPAGAPVAEAVEPPPHVARTPTPAPATLMAKSGTAQRIAALQRQVRRQFSRVEVALLGRCDALEFDLRSTPWGWQNRDRKTAIESEIRQIRSALGIGASVHWPPLESCF